MSGTTDNGDNPANDLGAQSSDPDPPLSFADPPTRSPKDVRHQSGRQLQPEGSPLTRATRRKVVLALAAAAIAAALIIYAIHILDIHRHLH